MTVRASAPPAQLPRAVQRRTHVPYNCGATNLAIVEVLTLQFRKHLSCKCVMVAQGWRPDDSKKHGITCALQLSNWFPVVSVTGPRQSGKSTLVREVFSDYTYVNLENPQTRQQALSDPVGFIRNRPNRLVIDEVQLAPELFSMIQVASDESNEPGQYVLSGSQNFLLLKQITQSLAGRAGLLKLLPLSFLEARAGMATLRLIPSC